MNAIQRSNVFVEKWIYLIMPLMMAFGIAFGKHLAGMTWWTPILFMLLTFVSSLNANYRKFTTVFRKPVMFIGLIVICHVVIPILISRIAASVFHSQPDLATGIALITMLPMGVTSIFWITYNKGDLETALSFVTINTLLSPFIVPLTFTWILGSQVTLDIGGLMINLIKLVLLPTLLGIVAGEWMKKRPRTFSIKLGMQLSGKICLYIIVLLNAAAISLQLNTVKSQIAQVVVVVLITMISGYIISYAYGRLFSLSRETSITVAYTGGVRNYTVGVVLAASFFPPLVSIPVLLAMMLQHPLALCFVYVLRWLQRERPTQTKDVNHKVTKSL